MEDLLAKGGDFSKPKLGSVVTGKVVSVTKNRLVVDLNQGITIGVVSGRETHDSAGTMKELKEGDDVTTVVVEEEDDNGMVVLSLKKASQVTAWDRFEKAYKEGEVIEIAVADANKGGLMINHDGIKGFIPVSQLAPVHYPRVENANAAQILSRLQKLIGMKLNVKIINLERSTGKMILSEKAALHADASKKLQALNVGDRITGRVSGVVKFGIFVTFNGLEGLVHISEIAWGHVSNPHQYAKVGDEVEVEIIGIEGDKLSLSMKRLISDPWSEIEDKYPVGSKVKGEITRFSAFGAFVKLDDELNGLIHLSEISHQKVENPADFLDIGQEVEATVINIDREEHRIGLSLKGKKSKAKKEEVAEEDNAEEVSEDDGEVAEKSEEVKEEKKKETKAKKADKKEGNSDAEDQAEEKEEKTEE